MSELVDQDIQEAKWRPLAIIGVVLILLGGFNTTVPTWLNYLSFGFFVGGVITLILAALEFRRRNKV